MHCAKRGFRCCWIWQLNLLFVHTSSTKMAISLQQRWSKASVDSFLQYSEEHHRPYSTLNKRNMATVVSKTYYWFLELIFQILFPPYLAEMTKSCCFHFRFRSVVKQEHLTILFCVSPSLNSSPALLWSYFSYSGYLCLFEFNHFIFKWSEFYDR